MYNVVRYIALRTRVALSKRLGQRGAEMVEYAIVLACIAAVAAIFYASTDDNNTTGKNTLGGILTDLWKKVRDKI